MINIVDVWNSVQSTAKKSTTGYQTKDRFNYDVELVQLAIIKALCEVYEKEQVISDDLSYFVNSIKTFTESKPFDYFRFVSAVINGEEVYPVHRNAVGMTRISSIRNKVISFYFEGTRIRYVNEWSTVSSFEFTYIRRPKPASINMVYSEDGGDYQTPVVVANLEWPDSMRNLIEAMLLERLGVETREIIAIEFGRLGIQRETANYQ